MEQHPVPQNVTTFQFRLIGDMTIKQFGYLAGGVVLGYISYKLPLPIFFTLPLAVAVVLLGFGMAFVPVEERPMDIWVLSFIKSIYSPTSYVWRRQKPAETASAASPLSQPETPAPQPEPLTPATPAVVYTTPVVSAPLPQPQPLVTQETTPPAAPQQTEAEIIPPKQPAFTEASSSSPSQSSNPPVKKPSFVSKFLAWLFPANAGGKPKQGHDKPVESAQLPVAKIHTVTKHSDILSGIFAHNKKPADHKDVSAPPVKPTGPDPFAAIHTTSVTGEHPEQPKAEAVLQPAPETQEDSQKEFDELSQKNQELETRLSDLASKLTEKSGSEDRIVELQKQLTDVLSERQKMESELVTLRAKITQQQQAPQTTQTAAVAQDTTRRGPTVRVITPETAIRSGLPQLTTFPNIVTGIIKDFDANLLPGVLVTVHDKDGVPLRALKTNKLGQFAASTPLPNATYVIEVEDPRNRFIFDRIQITLNGALVPAIEVVAKSQKQIEREKLEKDIFGSQQF